MNYSGTFAQLNHQMLSLRNSLYAGVLVALAVVFAVAVSSALPNRSALSAKAPMELLPDSATISGIISYTGTPPPRQRVNMKSDPVCGPGSLSEDLIVNNQCIHNVFVYVSSGLEGRLFTAPKTPVTLNQANCWFRPRVFGIMVGQRLHIVNGDQTLHDVHSHATINRAFNFAQAKQGRSDDKVFEEEEVMIPITDDVHGWKQCYIGVLRHPYFAVTGRDGRYTLPPLPEGTYTITIWHEKLGTSSERITVKPGESRSLNFSMILGVSESTMDSTKK